MRRFFVISILFSVVCVGAIAADDGSESLQQTSQEQKTRHSGPDKSANIDTLLLQVRKSLTSLNYEASFILLRTQFAESYEWVHGIVQGSEVEYLRSLNGVNSEIVRKAGQIAYYEAEIPPYSVKGQAIQGILPALFFDDNRVLGDYYSLVLGGKSRIIDRSAQLVRIVARDEHRFNYWVWLDIQSGLILKSALISKQGDVLEQFQLTRLKLLTEASAISKKLYASKLPAPVSTPTSNKYLSKWKIDWLPRGFKVISTDQHKLPLSHEITDYMLLSDGLVELSVFIQPPLKSQIKVGHVRSGPNIISVHHGKGYDVSVVGKVPVKTAERIAGSVNRR